MYTNWSEWAEALIPNNVPLREFYKIGEVADLISVKAYVLRYWETEFSILTPQKTEGNQRLYRRKDLGAAYLIRHLLYNEKFSIEGARNKIRSVRLEKEIIPAVRPPLENFDDYRTDLLLSPEVTISVGSNSEPKIVNQPQHSIDIENVNIIIDEMLHGLQSI